MRVWVTRVAIATALVMVSCAQGSDPEDLVEEDDDDSTGSVSFAAASGAGGSTSTSTTGPTASSSSSSSSSSTVSSVSSSASGGPTCDVGSCDTCGNCAMVNDCAFEAKDCQASLECMDFADCASVCADDACVSQCAATYPTGEKLYMNLVVCVVCDACWVTCDGATAPCP